MSARLSPAWLWLSLAAAGCGPVSAAAPAAAGAAAPSANQLLEIARAADQLGDSLRAQQYLLAAARSGASPTLTLPALLRSYVTDSQYRLAIDTARDFLRAHPQDARLRLLLASLYQATQLEAAAIAEYERVLVQLPSDAEAHFALAELLHELGQEPGRADRHFRAYLALAPHGENAAEARASLLEELPVIPAHMYAETLSNLLAPIRGLLEDSSVTEILINGPEQIFVERAGRLERTQLRFTSSVAVLAALRNVAQYAGTFVDQQRPILEARLPDGSRLEAVLAPIAERGPIVAIRRFSRSTMTLERLIALQALGPDAAQLLETLVRGKCNIVVAGGTGSGKTSLLNVLAACAPAHERVLVLEDTRELAIAHEHVLYLEARKPDERGDGAIPIRELFRASLRLRPDRIIVGEIRGPEALDMLQAMVSGHGGCLGTLHASTPRAALMRLETLCMMSDVDMPLAAIRMQIGAGIDVVVQVERCGDGQRKLTHITEVVHYDVDARRYELRELFELCDSALVPTGVLPACAPELRAHGLALPASMLRAHAEGQ